ncbi:MAG: 2OG-Fe(II) oxygenase [Cocleimonas sp.]
MSSLIHRLLTRSCDFENRDSPESLSSKRVTVMVNQVTRYSGSAAICFDGIESNGDGFDNNFDSKNPSLFARIAEDIQNKGYSINPGALPLHLGDSLLQRINTIDDEQFVHARIGREKLLMKNQFVRKNAICWITGESDAGRDWLQWTSEMQTFLNRRLLLGLFSFESHFSHYAVGDFYKRHVDAHKGDANRVLSIVVYLNPDWVSESEGELVLYKDDSDNEGIKVTPGFGTVVVFLSEEFPHEVLVTNRDRYAIAGWFRVNSSNISHVDPPL